MVFEFLSVPSIPETITYADVLMICLVASYFALLISCEIRYSLGGVKFSKHSFHLLMTWGE